MSGLSDILTTVRQGVIAANNLVVQATGSLLNISGQLTTLQNLASPITASTSVDIATNSTSTYFDGPTIAQGSSGKWFASGAVTVIDTAASRNFNCKLWDGTTVIASATVSTGGANFSAVVPLSGFIAFPSSNLRISVNEPGGTNGKIQFNQSGNAKDSTITAYRIA